jgi:uncharacterized protein (DUF488 family)
MTNFFTIGHSTRSIPDFVELLRAAEVQLVVDVRTIPCSRANPQYNQATLPDTLAAFQIGYEQVAELGGRRGKQPRITPAANAFWTNQSFHNYADYAVTEAFHVGLAALTEFGQQRPTAIMCSEAVWWRCHRRIIADYLIGAGENVFHILGAGHINAAILTSAAVRRRDGTLAYPAVPTS